MSSKKPVVLVIRDGWGRNPLGPDVAKEYGDATVLADTPFTDYLLANYPHSLLVPSCITHIPATILVPDKFDIS